MIGCIKFTLLWLLGPSSSVRMKLQFFSELKGIKIKRGVIILPFSKVTFYAVIFPSGIFYLTTN